MRRVISPTGVLQTSESYLNPITTDVRISDFIYDVI